ncbi:MAG: transporter [Leifsonia sp.]
MATILEKPPASGRGTRQAGDALPVVAPGGVRRAGAPALRSGALALAAGIVAATLVLSVALQSEFPLFAEASAARGRDCTVVASARHALDAALDARLPPRPADRDAARAVLSAIAAFDARTSDLATDSVADGLADVRGSLSELAGRVQAASVPGSQQAAADGVEAALGSVRHAWRGTIARVCS